MYRIIEKKNTWEKAYNEPFQFHIVHNDVCDCWDLYCSSTVSSKSFKAADHVDFWEIRKIGGVR